MYVITGATSRTGNRIARQLLQAGQPVRVIGRSAARLQALVEMGAQAAIAEPTDADALTLAFEGSHAAWIMLQPNYIADSTDFRGFQRDVTQALSIALDRTSVTHAVVLSSWGAGHASGNGPVAGLHDLEVMLAGHPGLNVLNLRAGYFMENTLSFVDTILADGVVASPFRSDLPLPLLTTDDIAGVAARRLLALDFSSQQSLELHGAEHLTLQEMTRRIGVSIGRPQLAYRQIDEATFVASMKASGVSDNVAGLMREVVAGMNSGLIGTEQPRTDASTGPTTYDDFIRDALIPMLNRD